MGSSRQGKGRPIDQSAWPGPGVWRDWLVYCEQVHRSNGLPSLRALAAAMHLKQPGRVGQILRGLAWPADEAQARVLLEALGAAGSEVERGLRLYRKARSGHDQQHRARRTQRPDWWRCSGYVEQVADIAPLDLLDRQAELAELDEWCTRGDEPYVWWQAPAWAGKSALMAWLVGHPPPGVWIVSFFVTARLAGQADSVAFTDGLIDQLSAITDDRPSALTSATARDRLCRQLLGKAAACAMKAGRQLVLVVDGLDEDCGSLPGSGLPSIAASLPKRSPDGLRVIVAGRPDPPIPADVAIDHPLRSCRIRQLGVSPHATRVVELAQRELDEVLAADQGRHNGLGYQILGLVTACGGGLDRRDLHQLTGRPVFEIDRLLGGVFGRTIAGRVDPHTTKQVFLFAHETLRIQATDRLGPDALADFATRLHTWAASYQHCGWPADTPGYLLRGYPHMLADASCLDRLVALATDHHRHDRLLETSGGDAEALFEIALAEKILSSQARPDLDAAIRVAIHRHAIAGRNAYLPVQLPAVWASVGHPTRADALLRSITDSYRRLDALLALARATVAAGDHARGCELVEEAETRARSIDTLDNGGWALADVSAAMAAIGMHDRSAELLDEIESIAESLDDPDLRVGVLISLGNAAAVAGQRTRSVAVALAAEQAIELVTSTEERIESLARLAMTVSATGDLARAATLAYEAEAAALSYPEYHIGLASAVGAVVSTGDYDHAEDLAKSITDVSARERAFAVIVDALLAAGNEGRAGELAAFIRTPSHRAQVMTSLAATAAASNDHSRAVVLATKAEAAAHASVNPYERVGELVALAGAMAEVGDRDSVTRLVDRAEIMAGAISSLDSRAWRLVDMAGIMARVGDLRRAATITRSISDRWRVQALVAIAKALAASGEYGHAECMACAISDPGWQGAALAGTVEVLTRFGDCARAESLARAITDDYWRAQALANVAKEIASAGDRARCAALVAEAEQTIWSLGRLYSQGQLLESVAVAAVAADDRYGAERLARAIDDPYWSALALASVAGAVAAAGDCQAGRELAAEAELLARAEANPDHQAWALTAVAKAAAVLGDIDWMKSVIDSIADPRHQGEAAASLAEVLEPKHAWWCIVRALAIGDWTSPLKVLARVAPDVLRVAVDEYLVVLNSSVRQWS